MDGNSPILNKIFARLAIVGEKRWHVISVVMLVLRLVVRVCMAVCDLVSAHLRVRYCASYPLVVHRNSCYEIKMITEKCFQVYMPSVNWLCLLHFLRISGFQFCIPKLMDLQTTHMLVNHFTVAHLIIIIRSRPHTGA